MQCSKPSSFHAILTAVAAFTLCACRHPNSAAPNSSPRIVPSPIAATSQPAATAPVRFATFMEAQEACLNYLPPADLIVYSEEPDLINILKNKPGYKFVSFSSGDPPVASYNYVVFNSTALVNYESHPPTTNALPAVLLSPMVYLHRIKLPPGDELLAGVERFDHTESALSFYSRTVTPATSEQVPVTLPGFVQVVVLKTAALSPMKHPLRMYAAVPEKDDGRTFTLAYEADGVRGHIRGEYKDASSRDGRSSAYAALTLTIVDGPLKP